MSVSSSSWILPSPALLGEEAVARRSRRRPAARVPIPPGLLEHYEVVDTLAESEASRVLDVLDKETGEPRALKLVPLSGDEARARREILAQLELRHDRIVRCYDAGVRDEVAFLVLERAEGSLEDLLDEPARLAEGWAALGQVAEALDYLRSQQVAHRDVKPQNILLTRKGARLADLGLAQGGAYARVTSQGTIVGTPAYMAPEQARGERVGPAGDIFSLAVVYYELVEGRLPYQAQHPGALVVEVGKGRPRPFVSGQARLAPEALELLQAALSPYPGNRPASLARLGALPAPKAKQAPSATRQMLGELFGLSLPSERSLRADHTTAKRVPAGGPVETLEPPVRLEASPAAPGEARPVDPTRWIPVAVFLALALLVLVVVGG